ncbi:MAG TPA: GMC family oxidoreductase [Sphingomicrobium sp.]|nr:GMC family oxidoreductase [Sphingomicrobium sp.]
MHLDLATTDLSDLQGEVCVIGAGPAGITAARRLLELGRHVTLIESGGTDYEDETSALNAGESVGQPYYRLEHARLRFFGGTAAIWGGRVAELDPIDFEPRSWVPYSGWPIRYEELQPYYRTAWSMLGLEPPHHGPEPLGKRVQLPRFDEARISLRYWGFDSHSDRFGFGSCADLRNNPNCLIVTHATVGEIVTRPDGSAVEMVMVRTPDGRDVRVRARAFVLAAGGIENARLLLASNRHAPAGVGNGHDLVGRFFMEHPHTRGGRLVATATWGLIKAFGRSHRVGRQRVAALVTAGREQQERLGILNSSLTLAPRQPEGSRPFAAMRLYNKAKHDLAPRHLTRAAWRRAKSLVTSAQMIIDPLRPWLMHRLGLLDLALLVRAEQAPNPDSRVTLSQDRDPLGTPRVRLDWKMTELDKSSVAGLVALFGSECERLGLGRVEPAPWLRDDAERWHTDPLISAHPIGGYHHMGTTRMADSARNGVTDGFGNVFGVHNLYAAGSSLFTTSGWANPTLTLMALALRTSERISARLDEPEASAGPQLKVVSNL